MGVIDRIHADEPGGARLVRRLLLVGSALLASAGALALTWASPRSTSPLTRHALSRPLVFEGRVAERLRAGPYLYLRVERSGDEAVWVATVAKLAATKDDVTVTAVARADTFRSNQLARSFSPLLFGAVRAASSTHTTEKKP